MTEILRVLTLQIARSIYSEEDEKKQVIDAARGIGSKEEMQQFVNSIAEIGRTK